MYYAIICKLKNVRKHPNADRLQLATLFGNQVIVGLDNKEDELGIYFPTDGQLSEEFAKANDLVGYKDPETGEKKGGMFCSKRRVRTMRLRQEKSDGFWCPISYLSFAKPKAKELVEGYQFSEINGIPICNKYIVKTNRSSNRPKNKTKQKSKNIMFKQHFDTDQYAYNKHKILPGSLITISLKQHGSSHRISYARENRVDISRIKKVARVCCGKDELQWKTISGTRRVELGNAFSTNGYYGDNLFRKQIHDKLDGNLKKGETIYGELVGWVNEDMPIMPRCNNSKLGKEFVKEYGKETVFSYGCSPGNVEFYCYRITMTNEDGDSFDLPWSAVKERCNELGINHVLELDQFIYDGDIDRLDTIVEELSDGLDPIGKTHIREGVVVRVENCGSNIYCLKQKNFSFKVLEGIIKDSGISDIEEVEAGKE